jgi:lycopene beta-cyclase
MLLDKMAIGNRKPGCRHIILEFLRHLPRNDSMATNLNYDFIIAGAGAAGLSLVWNMLHRNELQDRRILLVDRALTPMRNKTWCFWDDSHLPFQELIHHTWDTLAVRFRDAQFSEKLQTYKYHCVRSDDYAARILEMARSSPSVTLLEADIEDFAFESGSSSKGGAAVMYSSEGPFTAGHIFQSALRPPGFHQFKLDLSLLQHFVGWHIRTEKEVFDPGTATFMDFDVPQENGVTFVYVLPFSRRDALVEYTLFSPEVISNDAYRMGLEEYIEQRMGLAPGSYEIEYTEKGVIPMEDRRYPACYCRNVWNMGTMGGLTKPSTGYTFTRIQHHTTAIADALSRGKNPPYKIMSPFRFRVYDMLLLYNLHRDPETSVTIFRELFRKNRFDRVLRFLEEHTRFHQDLRIMASVPWMPFFRAIYHMKHRILTGA